MKSKSGLTKFVFIIALIAAVFCPSLASAETATFEALRNELIKGREAVLEGVTKTTCANMLARIKTMQECVMKLLKESRNSQERNLISKLQFDLENFRFQCALFEDGISEVGVMGSFELVLRSFVELKEFRKYNSL